ncbi:hypothetical protein JAAARDRAFT_211476 [Jaapia argillacea MUCL 33604]|uniref:Uncharacterized protein n=1 Tax=Jaapia argillacea MUCL 33604 TaxID=933084 RepID=A0A067PKD0_9AGAM|nr:hypothetical protein JAAARDRAFT_211476 [Jaapia argillacea MUCL 33604]
MTYAATLLVLFSFFQHVLCQNNSANSSDVAYDYNPILAFRPPFARSLPVQILITGVIFTLVSVLLIQLIFTSQYHWALAPVNFVLQISAVATLLISQIAILHLIFTTTMKESQEWPFMLSYISVDIPPLDDTTGWTDAELGAWLVMNATTSGLIQITHIQFLTLLYPSHLEKYMILALLGPIAIVNAAMQLIPMSDNVKLVSIADSITNVCNATLSLLFTAALFIWGFLINRHQAWRTDGGTAVFGVGAIILALASTGLTLAYIPNKDQYDWLPGLMWAVMLWQSFLGWWWWVGAGMPVGEIDELLRREEKRKQKRVVKLQKKKVREEKSKMFFQGVTGVFGSRRRANASTPTANQDRSESDGRDETLPRSSSVPDENEGNPTRRVRGQASSLSIDPTTNTSLVMLPWRYIHDWYLGLRHAHLTATRRQAFETNARKLQVYGSSGSADPDGAVPPQDGVVGWGLGSYGVRRRGVDGDGGRDADGDADVDGSDDEEIEMDEIVGAATGRDNRVNGGQSFRTRTPGEEEGDGGPESASSSMWWWGPLRRWRLQDSTVYQ